jgi:predicted ATPase
VLEEQQRLLRGIFNEHGGHEVDTQGDSFFVAFPLAREAVAAAVAAQRTITSHSWAHGAQVRIRMGLHTGEGLLAGDDYVGLDVHRTARITAAGHGGQILVSHATRGLIEHDLPDGVELLDLGAHRLKDLQRPEHIFQVTHPDLPSRFPPLRSLDAMPNNLPVQLTTFIGREREMAEIKRLLSTVRLVTLHGPGGAGKTRLAMQVAADLFDWYHDGVWLVELAPVADPGLVPQTVASALGLREPARVVTEVLNDFLATRALLLVLDNCEQVLKASADLSTMLLRSCPQLSILATSRESLGVPGEVIFNVPSLALPDPEHAPSPETASQYAAIRLFVERATLYRPEFTVTTLNVQAVSEICRRLDGIPLAIELAAARIKILSAEQIAARLEDRFRLLAAGPRGGLPHHQTLQAAMDWSYDLLSDAERTLFRRLAVFIGGFTLEAAEGVCADQSIETLNVLDLLARLVDKSLVTVDEAGASGVRYHLLETVRQYALDRLRASGEIDSLRARHRDFLLSFAERAEPELQGPRQKDWLDQLEAEHDNFRAALEWSRLDPGGSDAGLRLAGALSWLWEVRGYWAEGRAWLMDILSRTGDSSTAARVKALNAAASLTMRQGDFAQVEALTNESLALSRQLGDRRGTASCLVILGVQACHMENYREAESLSGEGLSLSQEVGDNWGTAWAQSILGIVARTKGDHAKARVLLEESLARLRALGNTWAVAIILVNLGLLTRDEGDYMQAASLYEEALALFRQLGDKAHIAYTELNLGIVASAVGNYEQAGALYQDTLALRKELQDKRGIPTAVLALACAATGVRQFKRAAILFGAAEAMREATGASIPPIFKDEYERRVAVTSDALGDAEFRADWSVGRRMSAEAAIEFARVESRQEVGTPPR